MGVSEEPVSVVERAVGGIRQIRDVAELCIREGRPEKIASRVLSRKVAEVEERRIARREVLYNCSRDGLIIHHSTCCALLSGY